MLVTKAQVQSQFLTNAIVILHEEIDKLAVLIVNRLGYASSRAGGIAEEEIRNSEIAVVVIEVELSMGRKRRLVTERLIRLDVSADCNRMLAFGEREGVFVLLHHVVRFHRPVV